MKKNRLFFFFYIVIIIALFFYSFTQVDLSLTLSRWSVWQIMEKFFQNIGYFNRSLSTIFYIVILFFLFLFYFILLFLAHRKKIALKEVYVLLGIVSIALAFSYNAFSYDLFNYIFDAKIITYYHQNPYEHKALDYVGNPMLSFMRWTHRTYPYGPTWLFLTTPLSFLGSQFFLPTFFLFKAGIATAFVGTCIFLSKIVRKLAPEQEVFVLIFFAFNPLVLIESLVSSHNDIVMMFFAVWSLYLLLERKYIGSFLLLLFSIGIKFATVFLLPIYILIIFWQYKKKKIEWGVFFTVFMVLPVVLASLRTSFQPWYLLYLFPFAALLSKRYYVLIPAIIISFFALLQYVPFLYLGNWDMPVPSILFWMTTSSIALSLFFTIAWFHKKMIK